MQGMFAKEKSLLILLLCFLLLNACGGGDDDNDDVTTVQREEPAPDEGENRDDENASDDDNNRNTTTASFNKHCRQAEEIEGSNFEYVWSSPGRRLSFDTRKNLVRTAGEVVEYTPVPSPAGEVGIEGQFKFRGRTLTFPTVPFGTIQGESQEYQVGSEGERTYLCTKNLMNEF